MKEKHLFFLVSKATVRPKITTIFANANVLLNEREYFFFLYTWLKKILRCTDERRITKVVFVDLKFKKKNLPNPLIHP